MCHHKTTTVFQRMVINRREVVSHIYPQHQTKTMAFIKAVRIQFYTKVVDKILFCFSISIYQMDSFDLGDPSLASALNSRYNGTLAQHQGAIYDTNSLAQPGSPVSQVYTSACKPESAYWHQAPEYNVQPVSRKKIILFILISLIGIHSITLK